MISGWTPLSEGMEPVMSKRGPLSGGLPLDRAGRVGGLRKVGNRGEGIEMRGGDAGGIFYKKVRPKVGCGR